MNIAKLLNDLGFINFDLPEWRYIFDLRNQKNNCHENKILHFEKDGTILFMAISITLGGYSQKRPSITVLNIDTRGLEYTPEQLGNLVRLELERLILLK